MSVKTSVSTCDMIPALVTWMKIKVNHNGGGHSRVWLRPVQRREVLKLEMKLTSKFKTSTFTFGGKSSSGWKHRTMATSRWIVARRSLLWMTDRRAAEQNMGRKHAWICQNSSPPCMEAKKGPNYMTTVLLFYLWQRKCLERDCSVKRHLTGVLQDYVKFLRWKKKFD